MNRNPNDEENLSGEEQLGEELHAGLNAAQPAPRARTTIKYVRYLLLLIMVLVALIFLFSNREQISGDNLRRLLAKINIGFSTSTAVDGEVYFDTGSSGETVVYKDGFAHATVEKLIITDKNGTEFQNTALGYREPVITANASNVMVYDSGGTGLMVTDSFSVLFETQMDDPIITARMNDSGYIAVVTEGDGYLAKVYVFDSSYREIYRYQSLSRYILDAVVTADQKGLAVSALNIDGSEILSEILYFKLSREEMQWTVSFGEEPCIQLSAKKNGTICGLFSWGMAALNTGGEEIGRYLLDNQVLQCYSLDDSSKNIFVTAAAENGDGTIVVCNEKGEVQDTVTLDYYAVRVDYCDMNIAVLGNQQCGVYKQSGSQLWESQPERAINIAFMGKNAVVIISETGCVYNVVN